MSNLIWLTIFAPCQRPWHSVINYVANCGLFGTNRENGLGLFFTQQYPPNRNFLHKIEKMKIAVSLRTFLRKNQITTSLQ
jgi:hypothetical protein